MNGPKFQLIQFTHYTNTTTRLLNKIPFINVIQPIYGCQRNVRKEYYRYCVG